MKKFSYNLPEHNSLCFIIPIQFQWQWTTDYQQQTAKQLQRYGSVFIFYEHKKQPVWSGNKNPLFSFSKGIWFFVPCDILPLRRLRVIQVLNHWINTLIFLGGIHAILRSLQIKKVFWSFYPKDANLAFLLKICDYSIYDCLDYFGTAEELILKNKTSLMTVNSQTLYTAHASSRHTLLSVPQGFRREVFHIWTIRKSKNSKLRSSSPIIGFIGGINHRLDQKLLLKLIKHSPQWTFQFIGPVQTAEGDTKKMNLFLSLLTALPNVQLLPAIASQDVPKAIASIDIGIIPYNITLPFNRYCYPMKLLEYFYMGKPVVATPIEELKYFPDWVKLAKTSQEWQQQIQAWLDNPLSLRDKRNQRHFANKNSWQHKINRILRFALYALETS